MFNFWNLSDFRELRFCGPCGPCEPFFFAENEQKQKVG